jgi:hypothetical protein
VLQLLQWEGSLASQFWSAALSFTFFVALRFFSAANCWLSPLFGSVSPGHLACWPYCYLAVRAASFLPLLLLLLFPSYYQLSKGGQVHSRSCYWELVLQHHRGVLDDHKVSWAVCLYSRNGVSVPITAVPSCLQYSPLCKWKIVFVSIMVWSVMQMKHCDCTNHRSSVRPKCLPPGGSGGYASLSCVGPKHLPKRCLSQYFYLTVL